MINWEDFEDIVVTKLGRDIRNSINSNQNKAISTPTDESLFIVAGPGSGKTTVMVLKILKFIFVDNVNPSNILATTFTRKAAAELRSRILKWGDEIRNHLINNESYLDIKKDLKRLDFNQIITGTLDSISDDILRNNRPPGSPPPVVIEDFVSNALMMRVGLFDKDRHHNKELKDYLIKIRESNWNFNVSEMSKILLDIKDRFYNDQVNLKQFMAETNNSGAKIACEAIIDYIEELESRFLYDFSMLEQEFLDYLQKNKLQRFLNNLKLILVDEYQDTNLLQERIYFELVKAAKENGGSITVVGDDDQSLYRFRGATVDLFTNFQDRIKNELKLSPEIIYLSKNYRSTQNVVDFCNDFSLKDNDFQSARVKRKPAIETARSMPFINFPILGMFRNNINELARDLSDFIGKIVNDNGFKFNYNGNSFNIIVDSKFGSSADIAILMGSPLELNFSKNSRLPFLLRKQLSKLSQSINVFNPRGQNLERIYEAEVLCGLILECIDPESFYQNSIEKLPRDAAKRFRIWRKKALDYIASDPFPNSDICLEDFVDAWRSRTPVGHRKWKREISLIGLVYKIVTWIPKMQDDVEGLVYLEAITRTIAQTGLFSNFGAELVFDDEKYELEEESIKEAIWNIFVPIATGAIDIDEDLLETLPDDRINIMSIHQSKGLEFPLVIVDVGSDFRINHPANAFKRYPNTGGPSCNLEDELRTYSPLGKPNRNSRDRAFDDLIRQYFVAFSRSQDCLLLVGLNSVKNGYYTKQGTKFILNVATGWDRKGNWKKSDKIVYI